MRTSRLIVPFAVTASLATAGTASAAPKPHVQLKGGDAPPIIPSLVQTRIARAERALDRLSEHVDDQDSAKVVTVSKVIRRQTTAAWRGAKYILRTAPPPVEDRSPRVRRLHQDDTLPVVADPVTTAMAVFSLTHEVSAAAIELTDGAHGNTLAGLSRAMFWTLDKRNAMVTDAQTLQPPVPPEDRTPRRALRQEEGAADFATLMPEVTQQLDDEQQHIAGLLSDAADLRPRGRTILGKATTEIAATEAKINTIWPPVPPED
jgi:predicted pyridoxine 5'-phosphate oxidase superfamily flavin-nucleotide-binding protein